ncbi:hypothetical protein ASPVEDRAFT_152598 [Aspergillus versicolor CBS 583.65]|uniref:Sugar phosphate transporter domain-containing protein n=1 Tax=Aspergillus versicolor CBS 583.65 TaxID=1036611 RepID=A0A1L9PRT5_ASPVE|nr:uncharacterized protein ASPVEDRAFT_152598 [Aspergillus versicolor CBS 583.65]OJJ04213.1 hypothetical protein ASPVEDRAFT_152598 [Aspergillus versicolor CBS 583.65]
MSANPAASGRPWSIVLCTLNWIVWSNLTILFNKWILESTPFRYPILLTTWHLLFATLATQILARTTSLLSARSSVPMTPAHYMAKIAPIGILYSGSLVCSNTAYMYLNVGFIQMLKASGPVITLLTSALYRVTELTASKLLNIGVITASVALTVCSEIQFSWIGVAVQLAALVFDSMRLVLMQMLTSPSPSPSSSSSSSSSADVSTMAEDVHEDEEREREREREHEGLLLERDTDEEACRISSRASPNIIESKGPIVSTSASLSSTAAGSFTGEGGSSSSSSLSSKPNPKPKAKVEPGKMDPLLSLYYTAPICAFMNSVLAWRAEVVPFLEGQGQGQEQGQNQDQGQESSAGLLGIVLQTGLGILLLNACVGFMLNVAVFTLIGKTSGLTMTLVSIPKNIMLIVASVVLWGTQVSVVQGVGYSVALAGLVVYAGGGVYIARGYRRVGRCMGFGRRGRYDLLDEGKKKEGKGIF